MRFTKVDDLEVPVYFFNNSLSKAEWHIMCLLLHSLIEEPIYSNTLSTVRRTGFKYLLARIIILYSHGREVHRNWGASAPQIFGV